MEGTLTKHHDSRNVEVSNNVHHHRTMPILRQPTGRGTMDALPGLPPRLRENAPPAPPRHDAPATGVPSRLQARRTRSGRQTARSAAPAPINLHAQDMLDQIEDGLQDMWNETGVESRRDGRPCSGTRHDDCRPMPRQSLGTLADMAHPHLRAHRTARGPQATHAPDNRRLPRMQTRNTGGEGRIAAAVQMRQPHQRGRTARAEPRQGRGNPPDQDLRA